MSCSIIWLNTRVSSWIRASSRWVGARLLRRRREESQLFDADLKDLGTRHRGFEVEFAEQVVESRVIWRVGSGNRIAVSANEVHCVLDCGERDAVST